MRAYIFNREIDDLRGTLFRQTMFAEFEKIIHAVEESGDALTLDVFKSEYHKLLETYFAENFTLDPALDLESLRIPHFLSRVLRLQIRYRHFRGGRFVAKGFARRARRSRSLSHLPQIRR